MPLKLFFAVAHKSYSILLSQLAKIANCDLVLLVLLPTEEFLYVSQETSCLSQTQEVMSQDSLVTAYQAW